MRRIVLTILLLLCVPARAGMDRHEVAIRSVQLFFGLTASGEAFLRAICRYENGRPGKRCGHEHPFKDHEVYGNSCLPDKAADYARTTRALVRFMQSYIFLHEWQTKMFIKKFAEFYHSGGGAKTEGGRKKANEIYRRRLAIIFHQIRPVVRQRMIDGAYLPSASLMGEPGRGLQKPRQSTAVW